MLREAMCNVLEVDGCRSEWKYESDTNYGAILVYVNARHRAHPTVYVYLCCVPIAVESASS